MRDDIARILDWSFDAAPYFIESEYSESGNLEQWSEAQGGLAEIPLATRLDLCAQIADALAAAHSVGVLHKDVKPSNVLIVGSAEQPRGLLTDFGIGEVADSQQLFESGITVLGMNETETLESTGWGNTALSGAGGARRQDRDASGGYLRAGSPALSDGDR